MAVQDIDGRRRPAQQVALLEHRVEGQFRTYGYISYGLGVANTRIVGYSR